MGRAVQVEVINKKTGNREVLSPKPRSYCDFFDPLQLDEFEIQLRLDWHDKDITFGEPKLDADIYTHDPRTGRREKYKSDMDEWHQTPIEKDDDGSLVYSFTFKDLELVLSRRITIDGVFDGKVTIVNSR